ncbi:MAG: ImmA/IrrE family metallo-endopeptidase [Actinobacteria bacterium]|nr:ImmA/IrrE family metallo-endopeptidase [Actinomycetota bacterium]
MASHYQAIAEPPSIKQNTCKLPKPLKGLYAQCGEKAGVLISEDMTVAEQRSVYHEELWHWRLRHTGDYLTEPDSYAEELRRSKQEREARVRAAEELIPDDQVKRYLNRDVHVSDVADELLVSEELVKIKVEKLRRRYGDKAYRAE